MLHILIVRPLDYLIKSSKTKKKVFGCFLKVLIVKRHRFNKLNNYR